MGAQWKQKGRVENAAKKGAAHGKVMKEVIVACKMGDPNPDVNSRLRLAIEAAKKLSVTKDTIERAIKKASGQLDKIEYELVTYEGFAPHKVPIIVECLTDNRNRTASNVRVLFRDGQIGSLGSVTWMFDRLGAIEATHKDVTQDIEEAAINSGAQNVEKLEDTNPGEVGARFFTDPSDLDVVSKTLSSSGWIITQSELSYIAKNFIDLNAEQLKEVTDFLSKVDDDDDVHRIYVALKS